MAKVASRCDIFDKVSQIHNRRQGAEMRVYGAAALFSQNSNFKQLEKKRSNTRLNI